MINPLVAWLLASPLHPVLSGNTLLLHYRGRHSGRALHTPVSYLQDGERLHGFAARDHPWWRNLVGLAATRSPRT